MYSLARPSHQRGMYLTGCCFPKGEGLRHPWLLSTIATALAWRPILQPQQTGSPGGGGLQGQ